MANSQRINPHSHDLNTELKKIVETGSNLSNDTNINVVNYHLNIEIALDSAYISGNVNVGIISLVDNLISFKLDLDSAYLIDSISAPAMSYSFDNNIIEVALDQSIASDEYFEIIIYYHGVPVLAGGYKGLRYETHDNNELIIATLSTPYLAHTWWPCKDGTQDKADSVFVDITIKDSIIAGIPVIALSNGILDSVISENGKKTFCWKHRYPVVPYYIMAAISNYTFFDQEFIGEGYSFPIDYYVFDSHFNEAIEGVALMPEAMMFFTEKFGPYPFRDEKYGMTQLGYYGAIENQTNSITNNMSTSWFFVSVHELAHMWFADMITCNTWHHGWLNEGFATYSEALFSEYKYDNYSEYVEQFEYYQGGTVYMEDVSNPFTVFQSIIYRKGAYVLHMLRGVLGDEVFFDVIYDYANDNNFMYGLATTEQFQSVCEDISGTELGYFFDQWIYDEWYPMYYYNYTYESGANQLHIAVNQVQGLMGYREVFEMPMEIAVLFADGSDTLIDVFNNEQNAYYIIDLDKEVDDIIIDPDNWILKSSQYDPNIIVGNDNVEIEDFGVYPNPSNGNFMVRSAHSLKNSNIDIYSLSGVQITDFKHTKEENIIFVHGLAPGSYILTIKTDEFRREARVVVIK